MSVVSRSLDRLEHSLESAFSTPTSRLLLGLGGLAALAGGAILQSIGYEALALPTELVGVGSLATAATPNFHPSENGATGQQG